MVKLINLGWKSFLETNVLAYLLASVTKKRCFYNMWRQESDGSEQQENLEKYAAKNFVWRF